MSEEKTSPAPGSPEFWDMRYAKEEYGYGEAPNDFLKDQLERVGATGDVLEIACGEGRNIVFVAEQAGIRHVFGVDSSIEGIKKTRALADKRGVGAKVVAMDADLADYDLGVARFDLVVSTFAHLPPSIRPAVHRRLVKAMRPGAHLILEAYTPENIGRGTGGPQTPGMCMTLEDLQQELRGLNFVEGHEIEREVNEGEWHQGKAAVVQVHATKA
jgi:SAM-dependent methyltransferase